MCRSLTAPLTISQTAMSKHTNTYARHSDRYDGWVYLAKSDTGHFKVGRSVEPADRISHFDT